MSATFNWQGVYQDGTIVTLGTSGYTVNLTPSSDWTVAPTPAPIPAGSASMERYVRAMLSGTFNNVTNFKYYRSDTNVLSTGVVLGCGGLTDGLGVAFATPTTVPNADASIPAALPGSSNLSVDPTGSVRYAPALSGVNSRWLRHQLRTAGNTPQGSISSGVPPAQASIVYDEN